MVSRPLGQSAVFFTSCPIVLISHVLRVDARSVGQKYSCFDILLSTGQTQATELSLSCASLCPSTWSGGEAINSSGGKKGDNLQRVKAWGR